MRVAPSALGRQAASLPPRWEKDEMRGFGTRRTNCNVRTPSPQPSPLWGEGVFCASFRVGLSWQAPPFSGASWRPSLFCARSANGSRACKNVVTSNAKPVRSKERAGVGPAIRSSVTWFRRFVARVERSEIRERWFGSIAAPRVSLRSTRATKFEGSGTPANAVPHPPHLAMRFQ
jgi:hypothetical protein